MRILMLVLAYSIIACEAPNNEGYTSIAYDIDSLLAANINYLSENQANLSKTVTLDSAEESNSISYNYIDWENELKVFKEMDINKPSLKGVYQKNSEIRDSLSNLTILSYELKEGEFGLVKSLNLYYLKEIEKLKKITAVVSSENILYDSERTFELLFDRRNGQHTLEGYTIVSQQRRVMVADLHLRIETKINY